MDSSFRRFEDLEAVRRVDATRRGRGRASSLCSRRLLLRPRGGGRHRRAHPRAPGDSDGGVGAGGRVPGLPRRTADPVQARAVGGAHDERGGRERRARVGERAPGEADRGSAGRGRRDRRLRRSHRGRRSRAARTIEYGAVHGRGGGWGIGGGGGGGGDGRRAASRDERLFSQRRGLRREAGYP